MAKRTGQGTKSSRILYPIICNHITRIVNYQLDRKSSETKVTSDPNFTSIIFGPIKPAPSLTIIIILSSFQIFSSLHLQPPKTLYLQHQFPPHHFPILLTSFISPLQYSTLNSIHNTHSQNAILDRRKRSETPPHRHQNEQPQDLPYHLGGNRQRDG